MEHPFVGDLSEKTVDELHKTMTDLTQKLNFCYRTQNQAMIQQLHMVLENYRSAYYRKMDEAYKKQNIKNPINITKDGE